VRPDDRIARADRNLHGRPGPRARCSRARRRRRDRA
jgi:hypothetical protein